MLPAQVPRDCLHPSKIAQPSTQHIRFSVHDSLHERRTHAPHPLTPIHPMVILHLLFSYVLLHHPGVGYNLYLPTSELVSVGMRERAHACVETIRARVETAGWYVRDPKNTTLLLSVLRV